MDPDLAPTCERCGAETPLAWLIPADAPTDYPAPTWYLCPACAGEEDPR